jgi:hypothetical protein
MRTYEIALEAHARKLATAIGCPYEGVVEIEDKPNPSRA